MPHNNMGGLVAQWLGHWLVIERLQVQLPASHCQVTTLGQLFTTHVPLSPSSIIWYRLQVGR